MRKKILFLLVPSILLVIGVALALFLTFNKHDVQTPAEPTPPASDSSEPEEDSQQPIDEQSKITGLPVSGGISRPVAVVMDQQNASSISGLGSADAVYEVPVSAQANRLLCLYEGGSLPKMGPVSTLTNALANIARPFAPILLHDGKASPADSSHLTEVRGNKDSDAFSSSGSTLYSSGDLLSAWMDKNKINKDVEHPDLFEFADSVNLTSGSAQKVSLPYSQKNLVSFSYNSKTKKYLRSLNGSAQLDSATNQQVGVDNLFILYTPISTSGSQEANVSLNSGMGIYLHNGTYTNVMWSKYESTEIFTFLDEEGSQLKVAKGTSWVCMFDSNKKSSVSIG